MHPSGICSAPLNVRPLFPRNSLLELTRILRQLAPNLRSTVVGAAAPHWYEFIVGRAVIAYCAHRPLEVQRGMAGNQLAYLFKMVATTTILSSPLLYYSILQVLRGLREGDQAAMLAGYLAGQFLIGFGSFIGLKTEMQQLIGPAVAAPLVAALVAVVRTLRR